MKIAYIAHPIAGDVKRNLECIKRINLHINKVEADVVPFVPYYLDCCVLDDSDPQERGRGFKNNTALLKKGIVDEVRLYGDKISHGMSYEINLAMEHGIPIRPMTEETYREYKKYYGF